MDVHPQLALPTTGVKFTLEQKGQLLTRILAEKNPFSILALPTREPSAELIQDHYKMLSGLFKDHNQACAKISSAYHLLLRLVLPDFKATVSLPALSSLPPFPTPSSPPLTQTLPLPPSLLASASSATLLRTVPSQKIPSPNRNCNVLPSLTKTQTQTQTQALVQTQTTPVRVTQVPQTQYPIAAISPVPTSISPTTQALSRFSLFTQDNPQPLPVQQQFQQTQQVQQWTEQEREQPQNRNGNGQQRHLSTRPLSRPSEAPAPTTTPASIIPSSSRQYSTPGTSSFSLAQAQSRKQQSQSQSQPQRQQQQQQRQRQASSSSAPSTSSRKKKRKELSPHRFLGLRYLNEDGVLELILRPVDHFPITRGRQIKITLELEKPIREDPAYSHLFSGSMAPTDSSTSSFSTTLTSPIQEPPNSLISLTPISAPSSVFFSSSTLNSQRKPGGQPTQVTRLEPNNSDSRSPPPVQDFAPSCNTSSTLDDTSSAPASSSITPFPPISASTTRFQSPPPGFTKRAIINPTAVPKAMRSCDPTLDFAELLQNIVTSTPVLAGSGTSSAPNLFPPAKRVILESLPKARLSAIRTTSVPFFLERPNTAVSATSTLPTPPEPSKSCSSSNPSTCTSGERERERDRSRDKKRDRDRNSSTSSNRSGHRRSTSPSTSISTSPFASSIPPSSLSEFSQYQASASISSIPCGEQQRTHSTSLDSLFIPLPKQVSFNANTSPSSLGSKPSFQVNTSTSPVSSTSSGSLKVDALEAGSVKSFKKSALTSPSVSVSVSENKRRQLEVEEKFEEEKTEVGKDETDDGFVSPKFSFTMGSGGIKHLGTFSSSKPKEPETSFSTSTFEKEGTRRKRELSDHGGEEVVRKRRNQRRIIEPGEDESNGSTSSSALEGETEVHSQTAEPATEEEAEYEVEKVLEKVVEDGKAIYLVKWMGYPEEEASWVAEENMGGCLVLLKEFEREN